MKQVFFVAAIFSALLFSQGANAQARGINQRQFNQKQRIDQGKHNGTLQKGEAMRLNRQQAKIRHYKRMARADGRVNGRERQFIHREQMRANGNIYRMKHNGRYAKGGKKGDWRDNYQSWDRGNGLSGPERYRPH